MTEVPAEALEAAAKAAYLHDWRTATGADWLALQKNAPEEANGYRSMVRTIAPILVAAGRAQAAADILAADTSGWPGGRGSDVDGCQERAAKIAAGQSGDREVPDAERSNT